MNYFDYKKIMHVIGKEWSFDDFQDVYIYEIYKKDQVKIKSEKTLENLLLILNEKPKQGLSFPVNGGENIGYFIDLYLSKDANISIRIRFDRVSDIIKVSIEYKNYSFNYYINGSDIGDIYAIHESFEKSCNCN